ncbi:ceramide-1-phosphate transfer protein-like [Portunus trituberculatus]|uniref:ceramide-1-phosphate transfer protein-like n=1 Tax=Portunus trituberculatus TaxID=210409 RepID=UPI001E1CE3AC|nr:ceramide-1-phosphate transfer protein-like [Portunus trituberculatus]XP_045118271.1 ceramide-1-phosphate transfer protein-like [Portunus trituberculatus]XP_045118272.1 ceramide-1-phosphate transfer protein-like [Portunus trituberculatus]XP_045118273.1 ceramide-1-phosphate transfer protein-like [Portunus trituberculatus]
MDASRDTLIQERTAEMENELTNEEQESEEEKALVNDVEEDEHELEDDDEEDDDEEDDDEEEEQDDEEEEEEEEENELVLDLKLVGDCFTPGDDGDVPLAPYLKGFLELNKFIKMLGKLYHFVAYDVKVKTAVVQKKMARENGQHYVNLKSMIKYEMENSLLVQKSTSGTKAILLLHRGMEFTCQFLREMIKEEEEPKLGEIASKIYLSTTGSYQATYLREPFSCVLKLLPTRATLRNRVAKGKEEAEEKVMRLLFDAIKSITETYDAVQKIYSENNLLDMSTWSQIQSKNSGDGP